MQPKFPCPCCGHLVFNEPDGSYDICPICFWEDDGLQLAFPLMEGGANSISLYTAQKNYLAIGACDEAAKLHVRSPGPVDSKDMGWRPLSIERDIYLTESAEDEAKWKSAPQGADLYYWRPTYWLS